MITRETKRIVGRFLQRPQVGDIVVNAHRQTRLVPSYRVMKVNGASVRLSGIDRKLDFIVRLSDKATRIVFALKE